MPCVGCLLHEDLGSLRCRTRILKVNTPEFIFPSPCYLIFISLLNTLTDGIKFNNTPSSDETQISPGGSLHTVLTKNLNTAHAILTKNPHQPIIGGITCK